MKSVPLIHISWLRPFLDYFEQRGASLQGHLDDQSISREAVLAGDGWITKQQLYSFLNAVADGENTPELGFLVGATMTPDTLGGIGQAISEAESLGEAIRTFCRLVYRSSENNHAWLEEGASGELWFFNQTENPFPAKRDIADHAGLMTLINLVRLVGGEDWFPREACLQSRGKAPIEKLDGYKEMKVRSRQPTTGFAFPAEWLLEPISHSPPSSKAKPIELLSPDETEETKLRKLLIQLVGAGGLCPTIKLVAQLLHTSPRSLHRWLKSQEITYRELLDEVRLERAQNMLRQEDYPIKEIAYELGYSGANNFVRAFKRLTGQTPNAYRDQISRTSF